jgi:hypothetical protein
MKKRTRRGLVARESHEWTRMRMHQEEVAHGTHGRHGREGGVSELME